MRTTLDLPEDLINELVELTGEKTKTNALIHAMKDFIKRKKLEEVFNALGNVEFDLSANEIRNLNER